MGVCAGKAVADQAVLGDDLGADDPPMGNAMGRVGTGNSRSAAGER